MPQRFWFFERFVRTFSDEERRECAEILWMHVRQLRSPTVIGATDGRATELLEAIARVVEP